MRIVTIGILSITGKPFGVIVFSTSLRCSVCTSKSIRFGLSTLASKVVLASKKSLVKYKVLIKNVPIPIAKIKTTVWLFGLYKFKRLWRAAKLHDFGKYFLMSLMKPIETPAKIENVTNIPTTKLKANSHLPNNHKANKSTNNTIATTTQI